VYEAATIRETAVSRQRSLLQSFMLYSLGASAIGTRGHVPSRPVQWPSCPGKMKLQRREPISPVNAVVTNPPPYQDAQSDAALRGQPVKWIRSLVFGNSRARFPLALTTVIMLILSLSAAAQNQYYISPTGSDSNSGTSPGAPWQSCAKAMSSFVLSGSGAVLNFIASATPLPASCNISRGGSSQSVRLVLKCTTQWTVGGTNCKVPNAFLVTSASNVDIGALPSFGFEVTNSSQDHAVDVSWQGGSATTSSSGNSIHVLGNYFHDVAQNVSGPVGLGCPQSGMILIPNAHGKTETDTQVIGNVIDHFGVYPNSNCSEAQGIYIATSNGIIQNNIVTRAAAGAIQYYDQACNAVISNNVLASSRFGLILYGGNGCTPGLNTVNNNIVVNNSSTGIYTGFSGPDHCSSGRPTLFSNNDLFGNGVDFNNSQSACETRQNQKSENPAATFVNYTGNASGDYHLKSGSVANAGGTARCVAQSTTQCVPTFDLVLAARPSTPSLGVYESGTARSSLSAPTGLTATVQ
jgi:hypothetical protein